MNGTDRTGKRKMIVTAFEPFGKDTVNASEEALALTEAPDGVELIRLVLPVVYREAAETLIEKIRLEEPDAVLCLGVAGGRRTISVEKVAINLCHSLKPDNKGRILTDTPVLENGPDAYFSTLPVRRIAEALNEENIPASVSYSAGVYVCNDLMYRILDDCKQSNRTIPAGFIHVPFTPEEAADYPAGTPSMPKETIARGITAAVRTIAESLSE